jgi:3beta-hydroxy-delta5-steroid dehydrogenase/steroid delta-isomerase
MQTDHSLGLCLVTGAAGFLGRNIVRHLLDEGYLVRALVNRTPLTLAHERLETVTGDIRDRAAMTEVLKGIETVFHSAAQIALLGGFFVSSAYEENARSINVDGTSLLLDVSRAAGTKRFIYTSSIDVCFAGKPLPNMTEELDYAQSPKSTYVKTKIEAEKRVLAENGVEGFYTCAVRPDGIWGAEPNDMIDGIAMQIRANKMKARIGDPSTLQDNSHVKSLAHAELLAAQHLGPEGIASGKAYFISDGEPRNTFEFFRPLVEGLGKEMPTKVLSAGLLRIIASVGQTLHFLFGASEPMLSPHAVDKVSVTHYASNALAEKELGFHPVITYAEGMQECVDTRLDSPNADS